jgi:O-antigen/teichoic acid export membrane protein
MTSRVEISKRLVFINSVSSAVAKILNVFVLAWLQQYLLTRISAEEYSLYPVLTSIMLFAPALTLILTSGLGRYVVAAYSNADEHRVTQIVSTMFPLLLGSGVIILAVGWILSWRVDWVFNVPPDRLWDARLMMALMVFSLAIRLPLAPFGVGLYVRQKFILENLIGVGAEFFRIGLLFILLFGVSTRVKWVVVATVSSYLLRLTIRQVLSRRLVPSLRFRIDAIQWSAAKELTSFGWWNFLSTFADTIRNAAAPIILNRMGTAVDVNCVYLGSLPHNHIREASYLMSGPLQPALTAMHTVGSKDRLKNAYLRGGRYALWAAMFVATPLMLFRNELFALYIGEPYMKSAVVMLLMLASFPLVYGNGMLPTLAYVTGQIKSWSIRGTAMHMTNLVLMLYFVGALKMGAVGAALATLLVGTIGEALLMLPLGLRMAELSRLRWIRETMIPGLLPALVTAGLWAVSKRFYTPTTWVSLGSCTAFGLACYVAVLFAFCLSEDERRDVRRLYNKAIQLFMAISILWKRGKPAEVPTREAR